MESKLPKGWEWKKLKELTASVKSGFPCNKRNEVSNGYIHLRTNNVGVNGKLNLTKLVRIAPEKINWDRADLKKGDIIFNNTNSRELVGKTCLIDRDYKFAFSNHLTRIRFKSNILPELAVYYFNLLHSQGYFASLCKKWIGQAGINQQMMNQINFPIPPLTDQQGIIENIETLFSNIDTAIALLKENIESVKKMTASIADQIFKNGQSTGWKSNMLKELTLKIGSGSTPTGGHRSYKEKGISLIRSLNVYDNQFDFDGLAFIDNIQANKLSNVEIKQKDVLLNITGASVTRCCIVPEDVLPARVNQHVCIIRCNPYFLNPYFATYLFTSPYYKSKLLNKSSGGATREALSKATLDVFEIFVPSLKEQSSIVAYLDRIGEKNSLLLSHYQNKLDELKRLKSSILESAFKGELLSAEEAPKEIKFVQGHLTAHVNRDPHIARLHKQVAIRNAPKQAMILALAVEEHEKRGVGLFRTKGEKIVHFIEAHTLMELGRRPIKDAAGPVDFEQIVEVVEPLAVKNKWLKIKKEQKDSYATHQYLKGENFDLCLKRAKFELARDMPTITHIIKLFTPLSRHQSEVNCTVYAAWNNLMIRGEDLSKRAIVKESRENWHPKKLDIPEKEFFDAITWLQQHSLKPMGIGKEVLKVIA